MSKFWSGRALRIPAERAGYAVRNWSDLYRERGQGFAGAIAEAVIVEAVVIEAVIPPKISIEEIPVTSRKLAPFLPVEIVVGPADPGRLAGDAVGNWSDPPRERGQGAAEATAEAIIVEAVMIVMPEAMTLAEIPIEEVSVISRKLASAPPVEIVVGPDSADPGCIARDTEGKWLDLNRESGRGAAGSIVEAIVMKAVPIVMTDAVIPPEIPIEEIPVTSRKLASASPVEIVARPNSADPG